MVSKRCSYGIQAILFLAIREEPGYVPVRQISETLGISHHFLTKILQALTEKGILISHRGPAGGVALAGDPDDLTLRFVIEAIDGPAIFEACVLGLPACDREQVCMLADSWPALQCINEIQRRPPSVRAVADRLQGKYSLRSNKR